MAAGDICLLGDMGAVRAYGDRLKDTSGMTQAVDNINAALRSLRSAGHAEVIESLSAVILEIEEVLQDFQKVRNKAGGEVRSYAATVADFQNQVRDARSTLSHFQGELTRAQLRLDSIDKSVDVTEWAVVDSQRRTWQRDVEYWARRLEQLDEQRQDRNAVFTAKMSNHAAEIASLSGDVITRVVAAVGAAEYVPSPHWTDYVSGSLDQVEHAASATKLAAVAMDFSLYGRFAPGGWAGTVVPDSKGWLQPAAAEDWVTLVEQTIPEKTIPGVKGVKFGAGEVTVARPGMEVPHQTSLRAYGWTRGAGTAVGVAGAAVTGYQQWQDDAYQGYQTPERLGRAVGTTAATSVGAWAGAQSGVAIGTGVGAFLGPAGAVVGGILGGIIGGIGGATVGKHAADTFLTEGFGSVFQGTADLFTGGEP